ncbi:MAG: FAD-dependent thymidylate synthase, partial [Acidobacteriaceae bacterium]|nr:FAD-dependent thymidylate synthase [Acidobacteriaceae bacterium]
MEQQIESAEIARLKTSPTFVDAPQLFVLARTELSDSAKDLYSYFGAPRPAPSLSSYTAEQVIEAAGRTCYLSFANPSGRSTTEYIENLIRQGHESVLEHVAWTFVLTGVSRAFTHQMVRHRVGFSYSQLSQQYVDHRSIRFVVPSELLMHPELLPAWEKTVLAQRDAYIALVESLNSAPSTLRSRERVRSMRSAARSVLPNCVEAVIAVTANARAWRHFLAVRGATEGDIEMRRVCALLLSTFKEEAPNLFFDFVQQSLGDGWPV